MSIVKIIMTCVCTCNKHMCIHADSESSGSTTVDLASLYSSSSEYQQLRASLDPMLEKTIVERKAAGVTGKLFRKGGRSVQYARNPFWQVLMYNESVNIRSSEAKW